MDDVSTPSIIPATATALNATHPIATTLIDDELSSRSSAIGDPGLVDLLIRIGRSIRQRMDIELGAIGVKPGQDELLCAVGDDEGVDIKTIASRLNVSSATVSKMAEVAERSEWIAKDVSFSDARRHGIRLTPLGRSLKAKVLTVRSAFEAELTRDIGHARLGQIHGSVKEIAPLLRGWRQGYAATTR